MVIASESAANAVRVTRAPTQRTSLLCQRRSLIAGAGR